MLATLISVFPIFTWFPKKKAAIAKNFRLMNFLIFSLCSLHCCYSSLCASIESCYFRETRMFGRKVEWKVCITYSPMYENVFICSVIEIIYHQFFLSGHDIFFFWKCEFPFSLLSASWGLFLYPSLVSFYYSCFSCTGIFLVKRNLIELFEITLWSYF